MKTIRDPESKILTMKISDKEVQLNEQEKTLSAMSQQMLKEEMKKEIRYEKLNIYQRYQRFKKMMNVYTRHKNTLKNVTNLLKIANPIITLENFFKMEGLDPAVDGSDYKKYLELIKQTEQDNPEVDLRDITSSESRNLITDIMNQVQKGKEIVPSDLDFVAVIEGYGLYNAMIEIEHGQDRDTARKSNGLTEEMLERAEKRKEKFDKSQTKELYDYIDEDEQDEVIYMIAAVLELGLGESQVGLEAFSDVRLKSEREENITEECLLVNRKKPELYKIDIFARVLEEYKQNKAKQQEIRKSMEDYFHSIQFWNDTQEEKEREYRRHHDGKPSPFFLRELKEYESQKVKKQQTQEQVNPKFVENEREVG